MEKSLSYSFQTQGLDMSLTPQTFLQTIHSSWPSEQTLSKEGLAGEEDKGPEYNT